MKNPLERTCEEYFIQLLQTNSLLQDLDIRNFDADEEAVAGIVVEATQGDKRLDGPKGFDVEVKVLWRGTTASAQDADNFAGSITDTVFGAVTGQTTIENQFGFLMIDDPMTGERANTKTLRKNEKIFTLFARLLETSMPTDASRLIYSRTIDRLRDADTALESFPSLGNPDKTLLIIVKSGSESSWQLQKDTEADVTDLAGQVAPLDDPTSCWFKVGGL